LTGRKKISARESLTLNLLLFVFVLLYFTFTCSGFIKNTKNLVSFIVVTLLLLVHYVVPVVCFGGPLSR
jgi:hypothetical protein